MTALAVGWATVDLDRAMLELTPRLAAGTGFQVAPDCDVLGARCRIGRLAEPGADGADLVILLEPSTEGRLAVTLARNDEGWCATWWPATVGPSGDPAPATSVRSAGPLGWERLVLGGPPSGPHRLLVEAATIAS